MEGEMGVPCIFVEKAVAPSSHWEYPTRQVPANFIRVAPSRMLRCDLSYWGKGRSVTAPSLCGQ
jgi:hypothetical protein